MSNDSRSDFHKRLDAINKNPKTQTRAKRSDRVGIYDYEEEKRRKRARFPWGKLFAWVIVGIIGMIIVKAFMVREMGEEAYQARLAELRAGEKWEPYAAIVISRDPLMMIVERVLERAESSNKSDPETTNAPEQGSEASTNSANEQPI